MPSWVARRAGQVVLALAVLYGLLVGLGLLLTRVIEGSGLIEAEDEVNEALADGRSSGLNHATYLVSGLGNTQAIIAALLVVAVGLRLATKGWLLSVFMVLAVWAQSAVFLLVTLTVKRDRPDVKHLDKAPPTSSFPSGHTGASVALFVASALLVAWYVRRRWIKIVSLTVLLAVPLLVAYARMYRGMHHPTDIVGAMLNGTACVGIAARSVLGKRPKDVDLAGPPSTEHENEDMDPTQHESRRAAVVYNPLKVRDLAEMTTRVESFMARVGWAEPMWLETTADDPGGSMCDLAVHEGCDVVFVCGGDGTVMAAVTALAGCDVPLAILPAGTGNLLARNLDMPLDDEEESLRIGTAGHTKRIDVGAVEGYKFAVMAGLGFDAAVMRDAPEGLKKVLGWPAYIVSGAKHLRGRGIPVTLSVDDGEPMERRVKTIVVGNVGKLQGNIPLLPDATADDGTLDVVVIAPRHFGDWLRVVGRVLRRSHSPDRRVERFRAEHVLIETPRPQPRQLDGDVIEDGTSMDIRIEKGALLVCVPTGVLSGTGRPSQRAQR